MFQGIAAINFQTTLLRRLPLSSASGYLICTMLLMGDGESLSFDICRRDLPPRVADLVIKVSTLFPETVTPNQTAIASTSVDDQFGLIGHPQQRTHSLYGDRAYDSEPHREQLRQRGI